MDRIKKCSLCKIEKSLDDFYYIKTRNRYFSSCKKCKNDYAREYLKKSRKKEGTYAWKHRRYYRLRKSAEIRGILFCLSVEDLVLILTSNNICFYCERIPMIKTIDRVNNSIGYTKDNCVMSCFRCNQMKGKILKQDVETMKKILSKI